MNIKRRIHSNDYGRINNYSGYMIETCENRIEVHQGGHKIYLYWHQIDELINHLQTLKQYKKLDMREK